jgi:hypothetical protein
MLSLCSLGTPNTNRQQPREGSTLVPVPASPFVDILDYPDVSNLITEALQSKEFSPTGGRRKIKQKVKSEGPKA